MLQKAIMKEKQIKFYQTFAFILSQIVDKKYG